MVAALLASLGLVAESALNDEQNALLDGEYALLDSSIADIVNRVGRLDMQPTIDRVIAAVKRVYWWGFLRFGGNDDWFRWEYGATEHCSDCLRLHGQVHTREEWRLSGLTPQGLDLACTGRHCQCGFVADDGPGKGDF